MLAFALRADGWYLRADIIWSKPNPMPESVTDRPTKAHEYVFLLTRSSRYFFDQEAVREAYLDPERVATRSEISGPGTYHDDPKENGRARGPDGRRQTAVIGQDGSIQHRDGERWPNPSGRNIRSVWEIPTQPYADAHFATFPEALVERCVKAGTSERGCCPECGAPWVRQVEYALVASARKPDSRAYQSPVGGGSDGDQGAARSSTHVAGLSKQGRTIGWRPSCKCAGEEIRDGARSLTSPTLVLDPFLGSGTTALVARRLGRRSIGIELSEEYAKLAVKRMKTWYKRPLPPPEPDPAQTALFALPASGEPRERLPDVDQAPPESVPTNKEKESCIDA